MSLVTPQTFTRPWHINSHSVALSWTRETLCFVPVKQRLGMADLSLGVMYCASEYFSDEAVRIICLSRNYTRASVPKL
ncbi:hypothetical protein TNCV_2181901 [Trichonephila clavipes]|uniref:Uncharacterized protein n=1 Tax=Trichonephila clavipes TaxID=2585209 RepID=A0A8X6VUZ9_TRICX|nr:hypothetical protein TNCV_2181901 [Trichonephila clavipes]